jgi:hypothetical protein
MILLAAGAIPGGCGAGVLKSRVQLNDVCKEYETQKFHAGMNDGKQTMEELIAVDVASLSSDLQGAEDLQLTLKSVTFTPAYGISDFGFVDTANVQIAATATRAAVSLLSYQKGATVPKTLELAGGTVEVAAYQNAGKVELKAQLSGTAPATEWAANVKACFKVSAAVELGSK